MPAIVPTTAPTTVLTKESVSESSKKKTLDQGRVDAKPIVSGSKAADESITRDAKQLSKENWAVILSEINLTGVTLSLSSNCVVESVSENTCELVLNKHHASLWNQNHETRISNALSTYLGRKIKVNVTIGEPKTETPAEADVRKKKAC